MPKIIIETTVNAPMAAVWSAWNNADDIVRWNAASDDWHTPRASVDLRVGGGFTSRMEARDGSMGFDFSGRYTEVVDHQLIAYVMEDGREVRVEFSDTPAGVRITETFDAEGTHSLAQQRDGWQAILDRFARHVEAKAGT